MTEQGGLKMYRFPDTAGWKIAFCVYFFVMLLVARDTMIAGAILTTEVAQVVSLGLMILGGVTFLIVNRKHIMEILQDKRMLAIAISTVVILLPMLVKRDWQLMYFSVLMCLYFAVFLTFFMSYQEIAKVYVLIISFLSVYSLFANYILKPLAVDGVFSAPIFINSAGIEHYNFGLCFERAWSWYNRNYGLFREPGVYQFFILISLLLNNYCVKWKSGRSLLLVNILMAITMLSTYATGGVIELALFLTVLFIDKKYYKDKTVRNLTIVLLLLVLAFSLWSIITENNFYFLARSMIVKLFNFDPQSSGGARYDAIFTDAKIFIDNPIFGEKLAAVMHAVDHNTTSTMLMFAIFGIFGGLFHVAGWVALVWEKERKVWVNLALLLILFMSFNTQNLIADVFFWLFPMMALVERGLPLLKCERIRRKA